ncbi:DUF7742 family protein [Tabrizicola oligotrophica]|uniref:DUF7742 domain-containing protein n=1 Tax=Tabrizicola oligotrophica TaxID=2710650 RepID=A0A6M0QPD0_9RHOB|nr:hypothetical protein [Tabrizicola oligotrophica]NEY89287.1 hypothetical protein [Tabrizicola oligotrophica]
MRRCMLDDLLAGAGRLADVPPALRRNLADRMIHEAHAAHHYMRRFGRPHPGWGNGSLMARALTETHSARPLCYASLAVMADAVARFRAGNLARGHGLSLWSALC